MFLLNQSFLNMFSIQIWVGHCKHNFLKFVLLAAVFAVESLAHAHKPSDSYLTLETHQGQPEIQMRWDIALRDLDFALGLDQNENAELTWGEVRQAQERIAQYAITHFNLATSAACPITVVRPMQIDTHSDGAYAVLWLKAQCAQASTEWTARYQLFFDLDPTHRGLLQWVVDGQPATTLIFRPESPELKLTRESNSWAQVAMQYGKDGIWHIWIGIDHILFLVSLLLPAVLLRDKTGWVGVHSLREATLDIVKVVTAFTLAHSITLSLAVLQIVRLPSNFVESVIAFSVAVAALNNLRGLVHHRRWMMAFGFGLLHGFGFASVLTDLGLPTGLLALALVSFNLGVEVGQLSLVVAIMPLAFYLRHTRFYRIGVLQGGSMLVALIAAVWTVERALGEKWLPF